MLTHEDVQRTTRAERSRAWLELLVGVVLIFGGLIAFALTLEHGDTVIRIGRSSPIVVGFGLFIDGLRRLASYRMFVAWRYLLNHPQRVARRTKVVLAVTLAIRILLFYVFDVPLGARDVSDPLQLLSLVAGIVFAVTFFWGVLHKCKPALYVTLGALFLAIATSTVLNVILPRYMPTSPFEEPPWPPWLITALVIVFVAALIIAGLSMFFGFLRAFFTFFTTVPVGGVWIGTSALVCVLSVMSGFESDLRDKILGSNAHIQITRDDGEFVNWREVKAQIDHIPGVVASTPYAASEVVIAANNNGMNVIIKGIDPKSVGKVTDLIANLEDPKAIDRMQPLVEVQQERVVPQTPRPSGNVVDPPPDDMPTGGDPIDFSASESTAPRPDNHDATDALPTDVLTTDVPPVDFSEPGAISETPVDVIDMPRRTQALPGILVGRELVKQTHLYTGEEVRVVSPLSDPSNPDATGTPIPFNRDYRVAGVFFTGMYEYDLKYVYVTLDSLQDFLDRGDAVDGIEIRIKDADDTGRYVPTDDGPGLIRQALGPGYRIQDWRELNRSLFSALKLEKIAMFLVLGIVILVASFSIVGNLIMVVVEKGREIALLKTLGASDAGVMQLFAIQGLLIGVIGTVLGVLTGLVGCWAGKKYGLPLNPDVYYIDRLPIHVDPQSVLAAAAAGVVISIAATFYPAMLAARVRPAAGMRH